MATTAEKLMDEYNLQTTHKKFYTFAASKIQSQADLIKELEGGNERLKGIVTYYQERDPLTGKFVFEDGTEIEINKPGKFDVKLKRTPKEVD